MSAPTRYIRHPRIKIVDPDAGIVWVVGQFKRRLRATARRLAPEDPHFWPDLIQEGEIALWEAQHWRLDLADQADARYLRRLVQRRMRNAHGVMHRQAYPKSRTARAAFGGEQWHLGSGRVGLNHVVRPHGALD